MLKNQKGISLIALILIVLLIVVIVAGIIIGIKFVSNENESQISNSSANSITDENQSSEAENVNNKNYDELMQMSVSINGTEIILNKTTIDEFLATSQWTNYTKSDFSTDVNSSIILKDGVNEIGLTYLNSNGVIFQVTTNENFDNSATTIQYKDSYIGTLNIGDNIPEQVLNEKYTINSTGYRFHIDRNTYQDLIILYESNKPIILNYLYHDDQNNLTGFSAWWYIY